MKLYADTMIKLPDIYWAIRRYYTIRHTVSPLFYIRLPSLLKRKPWGSPFFFFFLPKTKHNRVTMEIFSEQDRFMFTNWARVTGFVVYFLIVHQMLGHRALLVSLSLIKWFKMTDIYIKKNRYLYNHNIIHHKIDHKQLKDFTEAESLI